MSLRSVVYETRHAIRDRLFGNNQPLAVNYRYHAYLRDARRAWKPEGIADAERDKAVQFAKDGYLVLPPAAGFPAEETRQACDTFFNSPGATFSIGDGAERLADGIDKLPKTLDAVDTEIEGIIESYYRSYFKIFGVYFYRTVPTPAKPQSSFLWHLDNCPDPEIKLMVYLDDVKADTGAFRLKDKTVSDDIRAKGFRNRRQISSVQPYLDRADTTRIIEGPAGTRILFQNGKVVHKATSPLHGHRDVVTFVLIPSDVAWRAHFSRNRHLLSTNHGACIDPRHDIPQRVGYE